MEWHLIFRVNSVDIHMAVLHEKLHGANRSECHNVSDDVGDVVLQKRKIQIGRRCFSVQPLQILRYSRVRRCYDNQEKAVAAMSQLHWCYHIDIEMFNKKQVSRRVPTNLLQQCQGCYPPKRGRNTRWQALCFPLHRYGTILVLGDAVSLKKRQLRRWVNQQNFVKELFSPRWGNFTAVPYTRRKLVQAPKSAQ